MSPLPEPDHADAPKADNPADDAAEGPAGAPIDSSAASPVEDPESSAPGPPPGLPGGTPDTAAPDPSTGLQRRCWRCGHLPEGSEVSIPCPRCGSGAPPGRVRRGPGLFGGLAGVWRGLRFLNDNPRLWGWILAPLILNTAVCVAIALWSLGKVDQFVPDMTTPWWEWIDWLRTSLAWLLPNLMGTVAILACLILSLLVSGIVNAPFYDVLSERTEAMRLGRPDVSRPWSKFVSDQGRAILAAIILMARQVVVMSILFLLSFTAIGAPSFKAAGFFLTGLGLVDVPLARKRYAAGERISWGRGHIPHLIGLGLFVNLLPPLAPLGIVGATLAYLDQPRKG
jgi:uncharacterized protein involved in cysteine biosynthesis